MTTARTAFTETRDALHQVAEHLLAAAQFDLVGDIRLRSAPGGFETVQPLPDGRRLAVADGELVSRDDRGDQRWPLTTLRELAGVLGVPYGLDPAAYPPATPLSPDAPLLVDEDDARLLGHWYGLADTALRRFAGPEPVEPILWPEHFDIGITLDEVNYGASPGDDEFAEPYLYVGPYAGPPVRDEFWNARFGAALGIAHVQSVEDAVAFFRAGRDRLV